MKDFETIGKDILEWIECTERCLKPHNRLLYNIVMNGLEMMIVRMEDTNKVIGFETLDEDGGFANTAFKNGDIQVSSHGMYSTENCEERKFDIDSIPSSIKESVDDVVGKVLEQIKSEEGQ